MYHIHGTDQCVARTDMKSSAGISTSRKWTDASLSSVIIVTIQSLTFIVNPRFSSFIFIFLLFYCFFVRVFLHDPSQFKENCQVNLQTIAEYNSIFFSYFRGQERQHLLETCSVWLRESLQASIACPNQLQHKSHSKILQLKMLHTDSEGIEQRLSLHQ